ncbi:hypothetical protein Golax_011076 [Gossypium laxum]|uniref:Retrotransposon gag domain-containing protein n=1 Tax=Gossypium laxum TaxID=34288 RepID=A0A7J8ZJD0_9ROSI|nr:hypothetical protein [Gossypium laxum]
MVRGQIFDQNPLRTGFEGGAFEREYENSLNLQWAHGKAGEDRVHVDNDDVKGNNERNLYNCRKSSLGVEHESVPIVNLAGRAMARVLESTEEAYMEMVEKAFDVNPKLALMGSCILVILTKDHDDDLKHRNRSRESLLHMELGRISEESRIHNEHESISIGEGQLKVKQAFTAGFLKKEMLLNLVAYLPLFTIDSLQLSDPTKVAEWTTKDARVKSLLLQTMYSSLVSNVRPYKTAKAMWDYLRKIYAKNSLARRFQLEYEMFNYTQGNLSIQDYYSGFVTLWVEYANIVYALMHGHL